VIIVVGGVGNGIGVLGVGVFVPRWTLDRVATTPQAEAFRYPHDDSWESVTCQRVVSYRE